MSLLKKGFNFSKELRNDGNIQSLFLDSEKYEIVYININDLEIIEKQPFHLQDSEYIKSLAEDIKKNGLYSPLLVRKVGEKFEILSGRHRFLAFKILDTKEIPCILTNKNDEDALITMINANLNQRHNMKKSELAFSYKIKRDILKNTLENGKKGLNIWEELAKDTPYSEKTIRRLVKITELNDIFIEKVDNGEIKQEIYLELSKLTMQEQDNLCEFLIDNDISFTKLNRNFIEKLLDFKDFTLNDISNMYNEILEERNIKISQNKVIDITDLYIELDLEKEKWNEILEALISKNLLKNCKF